jgi:hypothetical protein
MDELQAGSPSHVDLPQELFSYCYCTRVQYIFYGLEPQSECWKETYRYDVAYVAGDVLCNL